MGTHPIFESDFDCLTDSKSAKMKCKGNLREFLVTGRKLPSATEPHTPIYRVRLFAPDPIAAKSRFWYFVSYYKKVNKTAGEIISVKKVAEKSPTVVKNFGIWVRYDSRPGSIQILKVAAVEGKDVKRPAIQQMLNKNIRFPLPRRIISRKEQNAPRFTTKKPTTMAA